MNSTTVVVSRSGPGVTITITGEFDTGEPDKGEGPIEDPRWGWKRVGDLKAEDEVKGFGIVVTATASPSKPGYTGITRDRLLRVDNQELWLSDSLVLVYNPHG